MTRRRPVSGALQLNGYTLGGRAILLAVMSTVDVTKTRHNHDINGNEISHRDGNLTWDSASIFLAGNVADQTGGFAKFTYTNYDHQNGKGTWIGHWGPEGRAVALQLCSNCHGAKECPCHRRFPS